MPPLFFADTTVLVNFAHVGRWDVLEALMRERGRWVASVEDECRSWVGTFATIHAESARLLGGAVRPEAREYQDVRIVRDSMGEPFERPQKHLGPRGSSSSRTDSPGRSLSPTTVGLSAWPQHTA